MIIRSIPLMLMAIFCTVSAAWGALSRKDVIVIPLSKGNRIVSTVTTRSVNEIEVIRTYQKPYMGNKAGTWRKKDKAIYKINCAGRRAALMQLTIKAKQEKVVFSAKSPVWHTAEGPELRTAFVRLCNVEIPKAPVIHPDDWLSLLSTAKDRASRQHIHFNARQLPATRETMRREVSSFQEDYADMKRKNPVQSAFNRSPKKYLTENQPSVCQASIRRAHLISLSTFTRINCRHLLYHFSSVIRARTSLAGNVSYPHLTPYSL